MMIKRNAWSVALLGSALALGACSDNDNDGIVDIGGGQKLVVFGLGTAPSGSGRTDNDRYIVRLNAEDGTPDTDFNDGAPVSFHSTGTLNDNVRRGIVEDDGSIVSAGYTNLGDGFGNHVFLIRLNANGTLDTGFGGFVFPQDSTEAAGGARPGVAIYNPFKVDGGFAEAYGAARLSNGDYVTTGYGRATAADTPSTLGFATSTAPDLVPFRVKAGGLDTSWGNGGAQAVQSEGQGAGSSEEDRGRAVIALADDRTVHAGRFAGEPALYVIKADGELDTSVSDDGIVLLSNQQSNSQFFNVALSPDGTRIAATTNDNAAGARLVILSVADFSVIADVVTQGANDLRGVAFDNDGRIVVSGYAGTDAALRQTAIGRFSADGAADNSFGDGGFVSFDLAPGRDEQSLAVVALDDGDIVAMVNARDADNGQSVYLVRLAADGTRQTQAEGWGDADGKVEVVFGTANANNNALAPPSDTAWDLQVYTLPQ
jgi:uncharacterized delta-60 repeat protein